MEERHGKDPESGGNRRVLSPASGSGGGPQETSSHPIGLLLLSRGAITDEQLKRALLLQREKGSGKIGKFLREIRAASEQDITEGLAAQWGILYTSSEKRASFCNAPRCCP
jgi:hypothetical protein